MEDEKPWEPHVLPRDGQAPMQGQLKITDGTSAIPGIAFNSEASSGIFRPGTGLLALVASGVENLRINSAGRVMIGTTTDDGTNTLQVNGPAKVFGAATLASTLNVTGAATLASTLNVTGAATLASTLNVTGAATLASTLNVTGAATLGSTLNVTGATTLSSVTTSGAATVGTTLGVTGNATVGGTLGVAGAASLASTLSVTGNSTFTGRALMGGATDDGTTPLQVSSTGGLTLSLNTTNANGTYIKLSNSGAALGYLGSGKALTFTGAVGDLALRSETGTILFSQSGTERARLDSSGNLGVGVVPAAWSAPALQVKATGVTESISGGEYSYNAYQYASGAWKTIASGGAARYGQAGDHRWYVGNATAGNPITWNQAMTLDTSGNLGVGTTSPGNKLHVIGNANLGATTAVAGAYQALTFNAGIYNKAQIRGYSLSTIDAGALAFLTAPDSDVLYERMRVDQFGNLVVGATVPLVATTDVISAVRNQNDTAQIVVNNQNSGASASARLDLEAYGAAWRLSVPSSASSQNPLSFMTTGASPGEKMRLSYTGNLQIGASADDGTGSKLQVAGALSLAGLRPTTINPATGVLNIKGDAGGWATGVRFQGSAGTQYGGFWGNGSGDTCGLYAVGDAFNSGWLTVMRGSGRVLMGTTTDDGSGARLQVTGPVSLTGANTDNVLVTKNSSASGAQQFSITHNAGDVWLNNSRGNFYLSPNSGAVTVQGALSVASTIYSGSAALFNGASQIYAGNSSGITLNYTGNGSQYGMVMKPSGSTSDTNAIAFLPSTATYASATPIASIQHRASDAGMNLSGSWALNGYAVLNSNQPTINKPTIVGYRESCQALAPGATVTVNPDNGSIIELTISQNTTVTLPAASAGLCFTLIVFYQGAFTLTFSATGLRWAGGTVPAATSVNGKCDKYVFTCGASYILGQDGGRNF